MLGKKLLLKNTEVVALKVLSFVSRKQIFPDCLGSLFYNLGAAAEKQSLQNTQITVI